jgi:hypothetical protein
MFWGDQQTELNNLMELAVWFGYSTHAPRVEDGVIPGRVISDVFVDIQCTYENTPTWRSKSPVANTLVEFYPKEKQLWVDTLYSARWLKATDQRDYIYSTLGSPLALDQRGELMVEPDYSEPLNDLHIRTARSLLRNPREAPQVLLRVIHHTQEEIDKGACPTWVPRWNPLSDTVPGSIPLTCSYEHRSKPYRAGSGASPFIPEVEPGNIISVTGFIFDTVSWTSFVLKKWDLGSKVNLWDPRFREAKASAIETAWLELREYYMQAAKPLQPAQLASDVSFTLARGRPISPRHADDFLAYCELLRQLVGSEGPSPFPPPGLGEAVASNGEAAATRCRDRRLACTTSGKLALIPLVAEPGDVCCVVQGLDVPVVLRLTSQGSYKLVGDAYVNGVMEGELIGRLPLESRWTVIRIE